MHRDKVLLAVACISLMGVFILGSGVSGGVLGWQLAAPQPLWLCSHHDPNWAYTQEACFESAGLHDLESHEPIRKSDRRMDER